MKKKIRLATIFSGIGAPEQAASRVFKKVKPVFACEIDKFARKSYQAIYNIPEERFFTDITTTDFTPFKKKVDLLVGGSPCQAFSLAGKRGGFEDTRGTLFYEFARCVKECQPKYFIFENVKGMVNHDGGKTLDVVLDVFGELGYAITLDILNTKDFGVPQNRERFFVVGKRKRKSKTAPQKRKGALLKTKMWNKMVAEYEAGRVKYFDAYEFPKPFELTKRLKDVLEDEVDEECYLSDSTTKSVKRIVGKNKGYARIVDKDEKLGKTLTARMYASYNADYIKEPTIAASRWRYKDTPGKEIEQRLEVNKNGTSNTITSVQKDNYVIEPNYRIRKLTPLECWRLQDFPDKAHNKAQKAGLSNSQLYKQAGNSMSVNVIEGLIRSLKIL